MPGALISRAFVPFPPHATGVSGITKGASIARFVTGGAGVRASIYTEDHRRPLVFVRLISLPHRARRRMRGRDRRGTLLKNVGGDQGHHPRPPPDDHHRRIEIYVTSTSP